VQLFKNRVMLKLKFIILLFLYSFASASYGQKLKALLKINQVPAKHSGDSIYIAGNFNRWNPKQQALQVNAGGSSRELQIELPPGKYEFKFTRGGWEKVEVNSSGNNIENRVVVLNADTVLNYVIEAWSDDFEFNQVRSTRSSNVILLDSAFKIPQLSRTRKIWIYLPKNYHTSSKRYPVLYMHDGQNLFDNATSGYGEWGVDEALDSLSSISDVGIVVGIENGPERLTEYNAFSNDKYGKGEGQQYIDFISKSLKPFIDKKYRTLPSREHTAIAGSSLGGLISYYAAVTRPEVFGKAGIFSPSFWIAPEMKTYTDSLASKIKSKIFFYIGTVEGDDHVKRMEDIADILGGESTSLIYTAIDPNGQHSEASWRKWFPEFYRWIQSDWTNYIIRPGR